MLNIFVDLEKTIRELLQNLVIQPVNLFTAGCATFASAFVLAWGIYRCYLIMAGLISDPLMSTLKDMMIKITILTICTSASMFMPYVVKNLENLGHYMSEDILKHGDPFSQGESSIFKTLDKTLNNIALILDSASTSVSTEKSNNAAVVESGEDHPFKWLFKIIAKVEDTTNNVLDLPATYFKKILTLIKLAFIAVNFLLLSITIFMTVTINLVFFNLCLGVGPLFIFFATFEKTKGWFSSWLNMTLGYMFSYPLICIAIKAFMEMLLAIISKIGKGNSSEILEWVSVVQICLMTIVFMAIIKKVSEIASQLFGSSGSQTEDARSGSMGNAMNAAKGAVFGAKGMGKTASSISSMSSSAYQKGKSGIRKLKAWNKKRQRRKNRPSLTQG